MDEPTGERKMTYELSLARLAVREAACEYQRTSTCGKISGHTHQFTV